MIAVTKLVLTIDLTDEAFAPGPMLIAGKLLVQMGQHMLQADRVPLGPICVAVDGGGSREIGFSEASFLRR